MTNAMIKTLALIVYLLVLLIHVYIVVLEMVLWKTRGPKVFRITPEKVVSWDHTKLGGMY